MSNHSNKNLKEVIDCAISIAEREKMSRGALHALMMEAGFSFICTALGNTKEEKREEFSQEIQRFLRYRLSDIVANDISGYSQSTRSWSSAENDEVLQ